MEVKKESEQKRTASPGAAVTAHLAFCFQPPVESDVSAYLRGLRGRSKHLIRSVVTLGESYGIDDLCDLTKGRLAQLFCVCSQHQPFYPSGGNFGFKVTDLFIIFTNFSLCVFKERQMFFSHAAHFTASMAP